MKKTILSMLMLFCVVYGNSQTPTKTKIYFNPITYTNGSNVSQAECYSAKTNFLMGISKAKQVSITPGSKKIDLKAAAQRGFNFILNANVKSITVEEDKLFSKSDSKNYSGKCILEYTLISVKTGKTVLNGEISGVSSDENESVARFESTTKLNNDALSVIDSAFPLVATQVNIEEADDNQVKTVIVNVGSDAGARKDMMFIIQKTIDNKTTDLATARLEQILGKNSSRLKVYSKKGGDIMLLNAMNNADEYTHITAKSRALNDLAAIGKDMLKDFGITQEDKGDSYPSDINRTNKLKVALYNMVSIAQLPDGAKKALTSAFSEGMSDCSTIVSGSTNAQTIEDAAAEGWNGLIDVTITNASYKRGPDVKTKDGTKESYRGYVSLSIYAINAATLTGINLRNISENASGNTPEEAITKAFKSIRQPVKKFFEDVFPVVARLETVTKFNKKGTEAKEAALSIGTALGVEKNTKFDIFKQNLSVGEDSREKIGHGEIKKDPEQASSILVIQSGEKEIAKILQSGDPDVGIIVVSRGHVNKVGNILKGLGGLGGLF